MMNNKLSLLVVVALLLLWGLGYLFSSGSSMFSPGQTKALKSTGASAPDLENEQPAAPVLLFGGDMMFDRYIRTVARRHAGDFLFSHVVDLFQQVDFVVANLEGPITENVSVSETSLPGEKNNYIFTFDRSVAALLKRVHIGAVNLGNNHISNFGEAGVRSTEQILTEEGIDFFGSPLDGTKRIHIQEIKNVQIALVNYNQFVAQGKEKTLADITAAKARADVIILYTHWGTEYVPATEGIKALAHEFIDAGVDLIIGSHPHVVQEKEVYRGKTIYYSLGNLIFDQYFSPETTQGLLVRVTIDPETKTLLFEDIPVVLKSNGQTELAN